MSHPYTSGVIKGFPRHLQRKSETPCERTPPPSPFCSSVPKSEPRGWQGTARKPSRGKHQHQPPEPSPRKHIWAPCRWCRLPAGCGLTASLPQGAAPRSPANLTAPNSLRWRPAMPGTGLPCGKGGNFVGILPATSRRS